MVRIDSLRSTLFALVPLVALTSVACGGGGGGEDPSADPAASATAEAADNTATAAESAAGATAGAAASAGSAASAAAAAATDDPSNGKAEGSEDKDDGFQEAVEQSGALPEADKTEDDPGDESGVASRSDALLSTRGATIRDEARRELNWLNKSTSYYSHTTYMNETTGTRRTDCSGFVGYALTRVQPTAYAKVPHPNTFKPLANDWYYYLSTRYTSASTQTTPRWRRITKAMSLVPGDLVVWLKPPSVVSENTGHLMVVNGYPRAGRANEVLVPVIDSTTAPHASDSRGTTMTGIGSGTIGLKVDSYGKPYAYYWRGGLSYNAISTSIALGRLE